MTKPTGILLTAAFAIFGLFVGPAAAGGHIGSQPRSVIELFTSQSCSYCPPANKLLEEYASGEGVLALSFSVGAWDWIGWEDTLASPDNAKRQRAYAAAMGEPSIYVPQLVVDGRFHVVGSDRIEIEKALRQSGELLTVPISLSTNSDSVSVSIGAAPNGDMPRAILWFVLYDRSITVQIDGGENSGRTITYRNAVKSLRPVTVWDGRATTVEVSMREIDHAGVDNCAFLLQIDIEGGLGPIIGAATISMDQ